MPDTAPVTVDLIQVDRTPGRGSLIALAVAEVDVGGLVFRLQGVPVRRAPGGRIGVAEPHTRGPDGAWYPAVFLPDAVLLTLGELIRDELAEAASVGPAIGRNPPS